MRVYNGGRTPILSVKLRAKFCERKLEDKKKMSKAGG